jgi:hypothetical protein
MCRLWYSLLPVLRDGGHAGLQVWHNGATRTGNYHDHNHHHNKTNGDNHSGLASTNLNAYNHKVDNNNYY